MTGQIQTDRLFRELYRPLCLYALHFTGDVDAAEDIVQECFVAWWDKASSGAQFDNARAYLFRSVRNRCMDLSRRKDRSKPLEDSEFALMDEDGARERAETEAKLWTAIDSLPDQRRRILLMAKRDGMSYQEIADELGLSPNTVRNQLSHALRTLREGIRRVLLFFFSW